MINKNLFKLKRFEILLVFLILFALLFWFILLPKISPSNTRRVYSTKQSLLTLKEQLQYFNKINHRYPESLSELKKYMQQDPNFPQRGKFITERISDPNGNTNEYKVLNGKGGWHYNSETGEIRVNLTQPIKHYVSSYLGNVGNEIPSDW